MSNRRINPKIPRIKVEGVARELLSVLKRYFPSWQQIFPVFLTILFPVTFWSILNFLRELPSYLMRMKIWEIIGVFAYTQVFALVESILLLVVLILIAIILPRQLFREHFTTQAALASLLGTLWIIPFHYQVQSQAAFPGIENRWAGFFWLGLFIILIISICFLFRSYPKFEHGFRAFIEKLAIVSMLYLVVDIASLIIIIFRNLVFALS